MLKMKCHVRIEITHSKRGVMQGFTTHSALETLRLHLRVTNITIRCKTLHNPTLVMCYIYIFQNFLPSFAPVGYQRQI